MIVDVTDAELIADRARSTSEWPGQTAVRTATELLLGISFFVTLAFGGYGAAVERTSIVAAISAIVFLCTLTCTVVNWFSEEPDPRDRRRRGWE